MGAFADARRRRVKEITPVGGFLLDEDGFPLKHTNRLTALVVAYLYHRDTHTLEYINGFFPATLMTNLHTQAAETLYEVLPELSAADAAYLRAFSSDLPDEPPAAPNTSHPVLVDVRRLRDYFASLPNGEELLARFVRIPES